MKKKRTQNTAGTLIISDNSDKNIFLQLQVLEETNISIHSTIEHGNQQIRNIKALLNQIGKRNI